jgi:diphthamide synthase (EF-2-diphthine--ammonia ligase)
MYQTVGHQLVAGYAACTALPLYRRAITGGSLEQRLSYRQTDGDEVEDLYRLLAYVKVCVVCVVWCVVCQETCVSSAFFCARRFFFSV